MPNRFTLIPAAIAVLATAYSIKTKVQAKKDAEIFSIAHEMMEQTLLVNLIQTQYLIQLINENDISVDEFDLIALKYYQDQ